MSTLGLDNHGQIESDFQNNQTKPKTKHRMQKLIFVLEWRRKCLTLILNELKDWVSNNRIEAIVKCGKADEIQCENHLDNMMIGHVTNENEIQISCKITT